MSPEPRKPNLFLIGAMKSGTTYLTKLLSEHPSIFMGSLGEPSYFVPPDYLRRYWRWQWKQGLWKDESRYMALFANASGEKYVGEGSTNYAKLPLIPGVHDAICRFNPDSTIIYQMRDPVKRTISHYWHNVRYHSENRPMLTAIRDDNEYRDVSYYAMQLRPYLDRFGPDRVVTTVFEELTQKTEETLRALFRNLEVDETFVPPGTGKSEHSTPEVVEEARGWGLLKRLRRSAVWDKLSPLVPRRIRAVGTRIAETEIEIRSVDVADVVEFLRPSQRDQTEELSDLLGRSFPMWTTLFGEG